MATKKKAAPVKKAATKKAVKKAAPVKKADEIKPDKNIFGRQAWQSDIAVECSPDESE